MPKARTSACRFFMRGATAITHSSSRRRASRRRSTASRPPSSTPKAIEDQIADFARTAHARASRRLRRRRDHGFGRLPAEPVHLAANQPARGRVGRLARESLSLSARSRASRTCGGGRGLHHRVPACRASISSPAATRSKTRKWLLGELERAGVTLIDTGIGWHEARVPTIAGMVPRAAFSWVTARLQKRQRSCR